MNDITLVLVHGSWHDPSCWDRLQAEISDTDLVAVRLPSSGSDPSTLGSLAEDVAAVQKAVRAIDGPVVIVAHSYGGVPVTEVAGKLSNVVGIVYIAAWVLDVGESVVDVVGDGGPPTWWDVHPEQGYMDALRPEEVFYNDVDPATAAEYCGRLTHQSLGVGAPLTDAAWRHVPSTYVITELDAAIAPGVQEPMSARAGHVHRLPSGHCPMVSMPAELAELIRSDVNAFRSQSR